MKTIIERYQDLWDYFHIEHNLDLRMTELQEIIQAVEQYRNHTDTRYFLVSASANSPKSTGYFSAIISVSDGKFINLEETSRELAATEFGVAPHNVVILGVLELSEKDTREYLKNKKPKE